MIAPLVAIQIENDGSGFWSDLRGEAVRIGLLLLIAMKTRPHEILVVRAVADAGNENFPDAAGAQPHRMAAAVPVVEVADDADHFGVRRPHREANAGDSVARSKMRAEGPVALEVRTFAVQVQIEIGQQRRKAVRVVNFLLLPIPKLEAQAVAAGILIERDGEETLRIDLLQQHWPIVNDRGRLVSLRLESADLPAFFDAMRTKHTKRIAMIARDNGFHFVGSHRRYYCRDGRCDDESRAARASRRQHRTGCVDRNRPNADS